MKANYKIVANKQKMLEKEIENFEPTSTMSVLLMRYSIIQGLLQVKPNEKDENGIPNISPVDMAYEMTTFFGDAVNAAADDFTNDDEDDSTIKFDEKRAAHTPSIAVRLGRGGSRIPARTCQSRLNNTQFGV